MQINVLEYLDEAAIRYAGKTAYSDGTDSLTFDAVHARARSIGTGLARQGHHRCSIAVFMRRHPTAVSAFFGVISSGCYYVPLDEEMPAHRIKLILQAIRPSAMIFDRTTETLARELGAGIRLYDYDEIRQIPAEEKLLASIRHMAIDTDPVHVVFTSGSTGIPKGVVACHRNIIDYIEHLCDVLRVNEHTVFGNQTPLYLDACLKELIPVLKTGAQAYIIPKSLFLFPLNLIAYLNKHNINTICWVVTALTMISGLNALEKTVPESLHTIAFASEVFPIRQFRRWRKALPQARFINLYGPTETTGVCCFYEVNREFQDDESIPIGQPFPNREILLLRDDETLAGDGEIGEICVRGSTLTHGYFQDFERTDEAFVQNPLNPHYPERIYRTGDLGRRNEYGELVFLSRKDHQIKHMGHRIELGEIEAVVSAIEGVEHAGSIYDKDKKRILLYYTGLVSEADIKAQLTLQLPRYMIPARLYNIDRMPVTGNCKIDRQALMTCYEKGDGTYGRDFGHTEKLAPGH